MFNRGLYIAIFLAVCVAGCSDNAIRLQQQSAVNAQAMDSVFITESNYSEVRIAKNILSDTLPLFNDFAYRNIQPGNLGSNETLILWVK